MDIEQKLSVESWNKIIAEFRGAEFYEDTPTIMRKTINSPTTGNIITCIDKLKYHSSWDWLMPVYGEFLDMLKTGDALFEDETALGIWKLLEDAILLYNIIAAHNYLTNLIKWYNQNKEHER